jgi:hypothetical protein
MQTTGAALIAVRLCSPVRMWMLAQGGGCAYGLLYLAAVRDDWREHVALHGSNNISVASGVLHAYYTNKSGGSNGRKTNAERSGAWRAHLA